MTARRQNSNCCSHEFPFSVVQRGFAHKECEILPVLASGKKIVNHQKQKLRPASFPTPGQRALTVKNLLDSIRRAQ
jgi:hypothetical protein